MISPPRIESAAEVRARTAAANIALAQQRGLHVGVTFQLAHPVRNPSPEPGTSLSWEKDHTVYPSDRFVIAHALGGSIEIRRVALRYAGCLRASTELFGLMAAAAVIVPPCLDSILVAWGYDSTAADCAFLALSQLVDDGLVTLDDVRRALPLDQE